jgi:quercetin dioxygenase-like cupin family protein
MGTNDPHQPPATEMIGASAIVFDLKQLARFNEKHPEGVILADTGDAQIVLLGMRAGQQIMDIETPSQFVAQCLRGRTVLRMGDAAQALRAGLVSLVEAHTRSTFYATTDCVLLLTFTPSPAEPAHIGWHGMMPLVLRS